MTDAAASLTVTMMPLSELHPDPANPRNNASAIEMVAASIRDFGFQVPIVVNDEHVIIAGHSRYLAAQMLKLKEVPVVVADELTPEQQRGFAIAENRTSDFSFFDIGKLTELAAELPEQYIAEFDLESLLADLDGDMPDLPTVTAPTKREGLDLAPYEKYQYVTIICRNTYDYTNLLERLGLQDLQRAYVGMYLKRGSSTGRIIEYPEFLRKIDGGE
jgi:hypothetical protein